MQCRSLVAQLGRHEKDFRALKTQVIVIIGDGMERAQKYAADLSLSFPVLADPERDVYHLYDLQKSFIMIQRTAAIIIDSEGVIQFIKAVTNPMTWLVEYEELVQEARRIYATNIKE